ncbi:hypothetical protein GCM10009639_17520 [Kitasatospora putterlickiae]|uniref:Lipoprotein n=1 Tax=Kitasatospora putterlickiae TaxID=221725 RepID=A0ABP4IFV9_9ACTN
MRRLAAVVAAVAVAVAVAVAGCGSVRTTGAGGGGTAAASASVPAAPDPTELLRQGVADHDRLFPEVAALGCASARPTPATTTGGTGTAPAAPADPWAAKHAENSMYKQMAPLNPADRCRGEAHGKRIAAAVKARAGTGALTQDDVRAVLESLGYPRPSAEVQLAGDQLSFEVTIPGTGPCVGGRVGATVTVEAHGNYLDGGCTEPKGGH